MTAVELCLGVTPGCAGHQTRVSHVTDVPFQPCSSPPAGQLRVSEQVGGLLLKTHLERPG